MATPMRVSNFPAVLKKTIEDWFGDGLSMKAGVGRTVYWKQMFMEKSTNEAFQDYQEMAGPGLMQPQVEGEALAVDTVQQGYGVRATQNNWGIRLLFSEQVLKFNQYPKVFDASRRLGDAAILTQEYEAASVFNRAFNSAFATADGLELCSDVHKLVRGGTFANELSTPASLSETAIETMLTAIKKQKGSNGYRTAIMGKKLIIPSDLLFRARRILNSAQQNDTANNAINAIKGVLDIADNPFFSSTSNWWIQTDVEPGLLMVFSQKPTIRQTNNDSALVKEWTAFQWFTTAVADVRCLYGSAI